jgi:DNA modification methylase
VARRPARGRGRRGFGSQIRAQIIWAKNHFAIGRGDYNWQHEPCSYAVRKGKPGRFVGDHTQSTLWEIAKPASSETGHSAQKPVECMSRPMENSSRPGDHVYDPFVGSGTTTLIAAEMTARKALTIEIDPSYCDVAILRWQAFANETATLADGTPFDELQRERRPADF